MSSKDVGKKGKRPTIPLDTSAEEVEEDLSATYIYRSPPFREATLPESPPPLPIPPRVYQSVDSIINLDVDDDERQSSTAHPYIIQQPQTSNPTRPIAQRQEYEREYEHTWDDPSAGYQRRSSHPIAPRLVSPISPNNSRFLGYGASITAGVAAAAGKGSGLAQAIRRSSVAIRRSDQQDLGATIRPAESSNILLSKWDVINGRKVLLLAYDAGVVRIYDCGDLSGVKEVLNVTMGDTVVDLAFFKETSKTSIDFTKKPFLGVLTRSIVQKSTLIVYSLHTHEIVKKVELEGAAVSLQVASDFVVVSTITPASIIILSSVTLKVLYTVPESSLELFATSTPPPATVSAPYISSAALYSPIQQPHSISLDDDLPKAPEQPYPHPTFTLHNRLLAYVSPSITSSTSTTGLAIPNTRRFSSSSHPSSSPHAEYIGSLGSTHSVHSGSSNISSSSTSSALGAIGGGLRNLASRGIGGITTGIGMATGSSGGITQKELGNAALKVGESVFSGMKFLGGKAVEALSSGGGTAVRVSRSADDEYGREDVVQRMRDRERRGSANVGSVGSEASTNSSNSRVMTIAPETKVRVERGSYVAVVDLFDLMSSSRHPRKIAEFLVSKSQAISGLGFTPDGTTVIATLADGHFVRTFKLNPVPRRGGAIGEGDGKPLFNAGATHVYNLRRGRTFAVIEGCQVANDGRWTGISTNHRTVHLFATNPFGGPSDVNGHFEGRVKNVDVVQFPLTELSPIARLRPKSTPTDTPTSSTSLAFTFLSPSDLASSPNLLPPSMRSSTHSRRISSTSPPTSSSPNTSASPLSPKQTTKKPNFQDVLLFDPLDNSITLYRLLIERQQSRESGIAASVALGVTSISLPGLGGAGRLGTSPSNSKMHGNSANGGGGAISRVSSGSTNRDAVGSEGAREGYELSVKDSVVAVWPLSRGGREWVDVKVPLGGERKDRGGRAYRSADYLSEAEISTSSKSTRVLPRSLYLSHQFSFYALGEDYHALIRRLHLDIIAQRIHVRTTVSINAYTSPTSSSGPFMLEDTDHHHRRSNSNNHNNLGGIGLGMGVGMGTGMGHINMDLSPPLNLYDFDEPIANAISGSFDNTNIPAILPAFPNGVAGVQSTSGGAGLGSARVKLFGNGIPIRSVRGGVSEGIGRFKSQIGRGAGGGGGTGKSEGSEGVPLEFDEEDEDFMDRSMGDLDNGHDHSLPRITHAHPHTLAHSHHHISDFMNADVVGTVDEELFQFQGWEAQDVEGGEEIEGFHHVVPSRYAMRDDVEFVKSAGEFVEGEGDEVDVLVGGVDVLVGGGVDVDDVLLKVEGSKPLGSSSGKKKKKTRG